MQLDFYLILNGKANAGEKGGVSWINVRKNIVAG